MCIMHFGYAYPHPLFYFSHACQLTFLPKSLSNIHSSDEAHWVIKQKNQAICQQIFKLLYIDISDNVFI